MARVPRTALLFTQPMVPMDAQWKAERERERIAICLVSQAVSSLPSLSHPSYWSDERKRRRRTVKSEQATRWCKECCCPPVQYKNGTGVASWACAGIFSYWRLTRNPYCPSRVSPQSSQNIHHPLSRKVRQCPSCPYSCMQVCVCLSAASSILSLPSSLTPLPCHQFPYPWLTGCFDARKLLPSIHPFLMAWLATSDLVYSVLSLLCSIPFSATGLSLGKPSFLPVSSACLCDCLSFPLSPSFAPSPFLLPHFRDPKDDLHGDHAITASLYTLPDLTHFYITDTHTHTHSHTPDISPGSYSPVDALSLSLTHANAPWVIVDTF